MAPQQRGAAGAQGEGSVSLRTHTAQERVLELEHLLEERGKELELAKQQISRLDKALHEACDYAEVCAHFPGRELFKERHNII